MKHRTVDIDLRIETLKFLLLLFLYFGATLLLWFHFVRFHLIYPLGIRSCFLLDSLSLRFLFFFYFGCLVCHIKHCFFFCVPFAVFVSSVKIVNFLSRSLSLSISRRVLLPFFRCFSYKYIFLLGESSSYALHHQ